MIDHIPEQYCLAHRECTGHREKVLASKQVGCFYCMRVFPPSEIQEWIDKGKTALCPHCHVDSVLPDSQPLTPEFLQAMCDAAFKVAP